MNQPGRSVVASGEVQRRKRNWISEAGLISGMFESVRLEVTQPLSVGEAKTGSAPVVGAPLTVGPLVDSVLG